jgi:hypothetical protein
MNLQQITALEAEHEEYFMRLHIAAIEKGKDRPAEFVKLSAFFARLSTDKSRIWQCAIMVHIEMGCYLGAFREFGPDLTFIPGTRSGADFLELLERNKNNSVLWERAIRRKIIPRLAREALGEAAIEAGWPLEKCYRHSLFYPDREQFAPLLPRAREIAAERRTDKRLRDKALIAIFKAYSLLMGKHLTPQPALRLAWQIDDIYRPEFKRFIPELETDKGKSIFGGALSSKATMQKLLRASLTN